MSALRLLPLVFALADAFEDGEAGFLGIGNRKRPQRVKRRKDFANRLFASGALGQRRGGDRPTQNEFAAADLAVALTEFVFVQWHFGKSEILMTKEVRSSKSKSRSSEPE